MFINLNYYLSMIVLAISLKLFYHIAMTQIPDTETLIKALLEPGIYPHKTSQIELVQTQMSLVFLTGDYAYKVKKPVNLGYLDYTTLEKRRYFCYQEMELNRRLSPEVYLEVLPVTIDNSYIALAGRGEVIDYAIKMQQLPMEKTLEQLLPQGKVNQEMLRQVANKMAFFHEHANTSTDIDQYGMPAAILVNTDENKLQTEKYRGITISIHEFQRINEFNQRFISSYRELLLLRVNKGRIRDCHGDLHAAHVCFTDGIVIFDCIEFNDRFRYCDVASEIAFLAMDIERFGRTDLSKVFVEAYIHFSKDKELLLLLDFYKCYRAYVRGKVESFKFDDSLMPRQDREKAQEAARNYFHLAYRYSRGKPIVIIMSGLVGTGKTTVAWALAEETGFKIISSDITRKELLHIPLTERHHDEFGTGIYSPEFTSRTYDRMFKFAENHLEDGQSVILDASFKRRKERKTAEELAKKYDADFLIIECVISEEEIRQRLEQRMQGASISDGRWEIFETQKADFDKITEFSPDEHMELNTSGEINVIIRPALERI